MAISWPTRWTQFHTDACSQGFIAVKSAYALEAKWSVEVGRGVYSSPAIGEDGTIYVGNVTGELVAVNPGGTIKWKVASTSPAIMSSPAVGADNNLYVIVTSKVDDKNFRSTLLSIGPAGDKRWSYTFPGKGYTTASPKIWGSGQDLNVFVYVAGSGNVLPGNELFIFDQAGKVVYCEGVSTCRTVTGGDGIFDVLSKLWDLITSFPADFDTGGLPLEEVFGWLMPTVAVAEFGTTSPSGQPIVVVVDNCGVIAFRWNRTNLSTLWSDTYDDSKDHSSPAAFAGGLLAVGNKGGHVLGYDLLMGTKLWDYDAGGAVMATPASFGGGVFVVSGGRRASFLHVVHGFNGAPLRRFALPGASVASPALSANAVYVSFSGGMHTFSLDLSTYAVDGTLFGGLSSPAIAHDGTVYVVTRNGSLRAYPAP